MVHRSLLGGQDSLELSEVQKARGSVFKCGTSVRVATVREQLTSGVLYSSRSQLGERARTKGSKERYDVLS